MTNQRELLLSQREELMTKMGSPGLFAEGPKLWFLDPIAIGEASKGQL